MEPVKRWELGFRPAEEMDVLGIGGMTPAMIPWTGEEDETFVRAEDYARVEAERDALARRVADAANAIHAWCNDEDKRDAIEFILLVLNILDPPVGAGQGEPT